MLKVAIISLFALPLAVAAADRSHGPGHRPPQEAIDACANSKRGDTCSVTHDSHTMTGVCDAPPDSTTLACRPDGPPPEAVEACASLKEGDTCTVTHGDHSMSGTCAKGPDTSKPLACRPSGPPPR